MNGRPGSLKARPPSLVLYTDLLDTPTDSLVGSPHTPKKLYHFSPREVADELCLMDAELLRRIAPIELEQGAWMKKDKHVKAANIMAMVHASNELALLVPTEVLSESSVPGMARAISAFIKIASKLYHLNNYNSLKAILAGLQCTPIYRLKLTWREVPSKRKKKFDILSGLMSEEHNWRVYSKHLSRLLEQNTPCIPFLGVLLTTTVQYESNSQGRRPRKVSGVEDYTLLEAITVRNRLESMRSHSFNRRVSLPPWLESEQHERELLTTDIISPILEESAGNGSPVLDPASVILRCDSNGSLSSLDDIPPQPRHRLQSEVIEQDSNIDISISRSFDGLKDLFTNWDLTDEPTVICVSSFDSLYSNTESSGTSSSSLPTDGRPLSSPPPVPMRQRRGCVSRESRVSVVYSNRASKISQCSIEIPSPVLDTRRRGSTLLGILHANTPVQLLARYQLMSFGCSAGIESNTALREIINDSVRNTEAQNYKLSYLREPS